jgi:hypothetical protein
MMKTERAELPGGLFDRPVRTLAIYSDDGAHRYYLEWLWSDAPPLFCWMLNPSTATHLKVDPTIRGMIARAKAWGYGGLVVINLFGFRATEPRDMMAAADPVGPGNNPTILATLRQAAQHGSPVICGWGKHGAHKRRANWALAAAAQVQVPLSCLAVNLDGSPQHPLYVAQSVRPRPYP